MKILVVRVGKIGDMVMCTPALSAILKNYPNAEITLLTGKEGKALFNNFDKRLSNFIIYDRKALFQSKIRKEIKKQIAISDFDYIYCFETKSSFFDLFNLSLDKVFGVKEDKTVIPYPQKLLDTVSKGVGKDIGFFPLYLPVEDKVLEEINIYLENFDITKNTFLVALHPSCSGISNWLKKRKFQYRIWPSSNWANLAKKMKEYAVDKKMDLKIVTNLLPEELSLGESIEKESKGCLKVISSGASLKQYVAYLKRVNLFITPDTGPMHMAAAVKTPMVALFAHKNPNDCGPFGNPELFRVLRAEDTDHPEIGISALDVETVYAACLKQMKTFSR